jgi:predicted membrane-bound spermidine synthase
MMRFSDFFNKNIPPEIMNMNFRAVSVLGILFLVVTSLVVVFILGPLWIFSKEGISARSHAQTPETISFLVYFSCLGLGFILVEIPLIQRFILFLGHPIYALSVILFSLLLFSGVGSYLTTFIPSAQTKKYLLKILPILGLLLVFYIFYLPHLINALLAIKTGYKILLTVLLLLPLGLLMGMPLPLGIKLVDTYASTLIPWVWGVNGATSVLASVLAMVLAITLGFSTALIGGQIAYLTAIIPIYFLSAKNE